MMNKIYRDLAENIDKIYKTKIVSVNNYFHHSLNYPEVVEIIKKYKGEPRKIQEKLFDYINQYEKRQPKQIKAAARPSPFGDELFDRLFHQAFGEINENLDPNQVYRTQDFSVLQEQAQFFELRKIQRQAQETGQVVQPDDISIESFLRALIEIASKHAKYAHIFQALKDSGFDIEKFIKDEAEGKANKKKLIEKLCTNLNEKAKSGKITAVIGRENEIEQLVNILKKARKNNPVLNGKAGVGKTAIVEGLAKRIVEGDVPEALKNAVIYELQPMNMVKGTSYRGQFEQNMSDLLEEFKDKEESGELPILFIDELHTIMGAGSSGSGSLDFSNIIKPALARGELRTIGATTTDEWYKFIKENPALDRRFVSVFVNEPSKEDALKIISDSLSFYEKTHGVKYNPETVEKAIDLSIQFIVDNALPDKAFDLIDYAGAMVAVNKRKEVTNEDVEIALAKHKNIALDAIVESRKENFQPLAPKLKQVIFGQDEAIDLLSRPVQKAMAGLNSPDKPMGAFLLTGPTGTGKTEVAKQIAKEMKAHFYRLDMSEFQERHSVAKLTGSPAGYVGYDDGSSLTKVINQNPRTVLLLDEIEKAHPDVYKLFLQVMDHGKMTDSKGKEINFKNVLLIMTSNAGISSKTKSIGLSNSETNKVNSQVINEIFSPEFRARLTNNGFIEFKPLTKDTMVKIVDKTISEIVETRLKKLNIELELSESAKAHIAEIGLSKQLGARPVKDFVELSIIDPLSEEVLFGKLKNLKKMKKVKVDYQNGKIVLN